MVRRFLPAPARGTTFELRGRGRAARLGPVKRDPTAIWARPETVPTPNGYTSLAGTTRVPTAPLEVEASGVA